MEIVDPCLTATLAIDENNTVFSEDSATPSLLQFVTYNSSGLQWDQAIVTKSLAPLADPCGPHTIELWQIDDATSAQTNIDSTVFTVAGLNDALTTLDVQTDDYDKDSVYTLRLVAYYTDYPQFSFPRDFTIEIRDYCFPDSVSLPSLFSPDNLEYTISSSWTSLSSTLDATWSTFPLICDLKLSVSITP